ncbi:hypothetical protein GX586_01755, partial [bacterium]|nr:hypothetical protein [bacterium]
MPASAPIPRDGFIRTWLALGPFTGNPAGLLTTSLIDEERVVPRRGARLNGRVWTAIASEGPDVNFMQLCPKWPAHSNCCAYVLAYIHAPKTTAGYLALGSDDGIAAWLNGVPLVSIDATRACIP